MTVDATAVVLVVSQVTRRHSHPSEAQPVSSHAHRSALQYGVSTPLTAKQIPEKLRSENVVYLKISKLTRRRNPQR